MLSDPLERDHCYNTVHKQQQLTILISTGFLFETKPD